MDIAHFSIGDLTQLSQRLPDACADARDEDGCASRIVRYLYEQFVNPANGKPDCALIRLFKTTPISALPAPLKAIALADPNVDVDTNALVLLGTAGQETAWNSPALSVAHQVIPLHSPQMVARSPMIGQLLRQLGVDTMGLIRPSEELLLDLRERTYNVFYVSEARGSEFIPAQNAFVIPYGIRSVIGFGGILPSGDFHAVIIFTRVHVSRQHAEWFKPLAISVKTALIPYVSGSEV